MLYVRRYLHTNVCAVYMCIQYIGMYVPTCVCVRIALSDKSLCYLFLEYIHMYVHM